MSAGTAVHRRHPGLVVILASRVPEARPSGPVQSQQLVGQRVCVSQNVTCGDYLPVVARAGRKSRICPIHIGQKWETCGRF